jgi:hypothetical protein
MHRQSSAPGRKALPADRPPTGAQLRWVRSHAAGEDAVFSLLQSQRCLLILDEADAMLSHTPEEEEDDDDEERDEDEADGSLNEGGADATVHSKEEEDVVSSGTRGSRDGRLGNDEFDPAFGAAPDISGGSVSTRALDHRSHSASSIPGSRHHPPPGSARRAATMGPHAQQLLLQQQARSSLHPAPSETSTVTPEVVWSAWSNRTAVLKRMRLANFVERLLEDCPGVRVAIGAAQPLSVALAELVHESALQEDHPNKQNRAGAPAASVTAGAAAAAAAAAAAGASAIARGATAASSSFGPSTAGSGTAATSSATGDSPTDSGDGEADARRSKRLVIGPEGETEYTAPALSSVEAGRLLAHLASRRARVITTEEVFRTVRRAAPERPTGSTEAAWLQVRQALACREAGDAIACVLPLTPGIVADVVKRLGSAVKPVSLITAIRRSANALQADPKVTQSIGAVAAQRAKLEARSAPALQHFPSGSKHTAGDIAAGALMVLPVGAEPSDAVIETAFR